MGELVLLIGNGINRLSLSEGPSWSQLLENIQKDNGSKVNMDNDFKPFPSNMNYAESLKKVKQSISKAFLATVPNHYHENIIRSENIKNIITTNYDYSFEKALIPSFSNTVEKETGYVTKENKYSLRRRNVIGEKSIWHIHGELYDPKNYKEIKRHFKEESIMIGYEHYAEYLKVLQDYKNGKNNWAKSSLSQKLKEQRNLRSCWVDFFFVDHLVIIGIDLSFAEIDLWWLLNYRARILKESKHKSVLPDYFKNGSVTFLYPTISTRYIREMSDRDKISGDKIQRDLDKAKARGEILKAFEVKVEDVQSKSYEDFYNTFCINYLS